MKMSSSLDGMEGQDELSETKRKSRNKSEKKRRDAFNKLITELHSMVTSGDRKLDKTNVLMQTIAYLKLHNQANISGPDCLGPDRWKPTFLTNQEYSCLMMEGIDAFVMVVACSTGIIMFSSDALSNLLDTKKNLKGSSVFDILDKKSGSGLQKFLSAEVLRAASAHQNSGNEEKLLKSLNVRVENTGGHSISLRLAGRFKRVPFSAEDMYDLTDRGVAISPTTETLCFICVGRPISLTSNRNTAYRPLTGEKMEFTATYNMEWKFIGLDQRALSVIGYLPLEVMGTSGYDYYHPDELGIIVQDHKQLIEKGKTTSPPYRFLTKGQQWIWLQTRSYITYHQWNSKPEFVVATSWVVPDSETKSEEPTEAAVSSTSSMSALPKVKTEPLVKQACGAESKDGPSKQIFRPQPGVSIEHSPISMSPRPGPARRGTSSPGAAALSGIESEEVTNERRLCEHLQKRHTSLQQQIVEHEQELRALKEQLSRTHPADLMAPPAGMQQPQLLATLAVTPQPNSTFHHHSRTTQVTYSSCPAPLSAPTPESISQCQNLANQLPPPQTWTQM